LFSSVSQFTPAGVVYKRRDLDGSKAMLGLLHVARLSPTGIAFFMPPVANLPHEEETVQIPTQSEQ